MQGDYNFSFILNIINQLFEIIERTNTTERNDGAL